MPLHFVGEYNHIYFLRDGRRLLQIRDRGQRKPPVRFEEERLEDLCVPPRPESEFFMHGSMPSSDAGRDISFAGRTLLAAGDETTIRVLGGCCSYNLRCQRIASDASSSAVLLTLVIPDHARYRVRWDSVSRNGNTFDLGEAIRLTVDSPVPWQYDDGTLTLETAEEQAQIAFLVESSAIELRLSESPIYFRRGNEREALIARAAAGRGFVPLFETDSDLPQRSTKTRPRTIIGPSDTTLYGPMLLLALAHDAELAFGEGPAVELRDAQNALVRRWHRNDLIDTVLDELARDGADEIVFCESVADDLLGAQAVGYADLRGCPIIFIAPIAEDAVPGSAVELRAVATRAIPPHLRVREESNITVFTAVLPLHLVETGRGKETWQDCHVVAHLPGATASWLVPRHYKMSAAQTPDSTFGVIFDPLAMVVETEGTAVEVELAKGLAHPILLHGHNARREVLEEVIQRFDVDLLLIATHASENWIEDGVGAHIEARAIAEWRFRASPVVFNNACSSWTATGDAFVRAGARAVISTLWPITNRYAGEIASAVGRTLHQGETPDPAVLLHAALRNLAHSGDDAQAYLYVGVPGAQFFAREALDPEEGVAALMHSYRTIYDALGVLVADGRVRAAVAVHAAATASLRGRFASLVVPGQLAMHFPPPMTLFSVLEGELLLALADASFGRALLQAVPLETQYSIIEFIERRLLTALREIGDWENRHQRNSGSTPEPASELPAGAIGEAGMHRLLVGVAANELLPFVSALADLHDDERASFWFQLAAKMVTTPADISADGMVTDDALIGRLREGVKQKSRVLHARDASEEGGLIEVQLFESRSDVANRFGIACNRMRQLERAARFFELAKELAEEGSAHSANAASNFANIARQLGRAQSILELKAALADQAARNDARNAIITTANLLRAAASSRVILDTDVISRALQWAAGLETPVERVKFRSDILGAAACYWMSRGEPSRADEIHGQMLADLATNESVPDIAVHLNEPCTWLYEQRMFDRSARLAIRNAEALERTGLREVAARSYMAAATTFIHSYQQSAHKSALSGFLDCSERAARIIRGGRFALSDVTEFIESVRENTRGIWEDAERLRDLDLALPAYRAMAEWEPAVQSEKWNVLGHVFHPRNLEAIEHLRGRGALRREVLVRIDDAPSITLAVTTHRDGGDDGAPASVYSYLPLSPIYEHVTIEPGGFSVAGNAVFLLSRNGRVCVTETGVGGLRTDGHDLFLYEEVWGSGSIPYRLTLTLGRTFFVRDAECSADVVATIRYGGEGAVLTFEPSTARPWSGTIRAVFVRAPKVADLFNTSSPFGEALPLPLYRTMLKLAASKND